MEAISMHDESKITSIVDVHIIISISGVVFIRSASIISTFDVRPRESCFSHLLHCGSKLVCRTRVVRLWGCGRLVMMQMLVFTVSDFRSTHSIW